MQYNEIKIVNFRGIRTCHVKDLNLVNLFFGKNNCGKSSLLKSIFILSKSSNPTIPVVINKGGTLVGSKEENIFTDFYQLNSDNTIKISSIGKNQRNLEISMLQSQCKDISVDSPTQIAAENKANHANENEMLADIIKNKKEETIIDALRLIEPKIKNIQLIDNSIMVDVGYATLLPVNVLGDGVRKVLNIILSIHKCSNGILLVDEIDSGLHHTVMQKLWEVIMKMCQEFHVQFFASTHSLDIIKSLVEVINKNAGKDLPVSAYKLLKKEDDELVALRYGTKELSYVIGQEVEVR